MKKLNRLLDLAFNLPFAVKVWLATYCARRQGANRKVAMTVANGYFLFAIAPRKKK